MHFNSLSYEKSSVHRGYTNRLLRIDLSSHAISVEEIPAAVRDMFVGGRGYCLKLVFDGTTENTKYDSPENVLALAGGPFCGESGFVGTGKFIVGSISPLTQSFCDSNVGGYFFPLVKHAGFDAISITGKSDQEVLVVIDGDRGEIQITEAPAAEFSLLEPQDLIDRFRDNGKPSHVAYVTSGTGSKHTLFGCINSVYYDAQRHRCRTKQAGRGGLSTVMYEKGLRGIVAKCDMSKGISNEPVNRDLLRSASKQLRKVIRDVDPNAMRLGHRGTTALIDMMNPHNLLPVNNYQFGSDERVKDISCTIFEDRVFEQKKPDGCFPGCTLGCTKGCERYTLKTGPHAGSVVAVDGPEYETAAAVTNLGVFDIDGILEYAWYCDAYGLDSISAGVVMAFLFEAYERNLITSHDTEGLALTWGDTDTVMEVLHRMASGTSPFLREAGRGLRHVKEVVAALAASRNGRAIEDVRSELDLFAMECKGLEFSMYVTKESLAQQGGYGFALKGPQHDESWLIGIDQINNELPTFEMKAAALKWFPLFRTWFNIVGLCKLPWIDVRHPEAKNTDNPAKNLPTIEYYVDLVNGTLGTDKTLEDLLEESERSYLLHKLINLRQGFGTRRHDAIPLRAMAPVFMKEFLSRKEYYESYLRENAGIDIHGMDDAAMLSALQQYRIEQYETLTDVVYREKGYDRNGVPLDETLTRLGFTDDVYRDVVRTARERVEN